MNGWSISKKQVWTLFYTKLISLSVRDIRECWRKFFSSFRFMRYKVRESLLKKWSRVSPNITIYKNWLLKFIILFTLWQYLRKLCTFRAQVHVCLWINESIRDCVNIEEILFYLETKHFVLIYSPIELYLAIRFCPSISIFLLFSLSLSTIFSLYCFVIILLWSFLQEYSQIIFSTFSVTFFASSYR